MPARYSVSIHAPRCRGAMHLSAGQDAVSAPFQSTLPVAGERCLRRGRHRPNDRLVSIHAPRCRGAMLLDSATCRPRAWFQSTLPVAGERCLDGARSKGNGQGFNPRSPLPGSDAPPSARQFLRSQVSIHAPRCRGAMRGGLVPPEHGKIVSIHAPRCRGAMLDADVRDVVDLGVSIHAPRCRGAMLQLEVAELAGAQFQSTLPVAGERCTGRRQAVSGHPEVSIHAPRCRGAMPVRMSNARRR